MKERPILFSSEMVRAILEGKKSQTRRVVKDKHYTQWQIDNGIPHNGQDSIVMDVNGETIIPLSYLKVIYDEHADRVGGRIFCPYGSEGDRLWVREVWLKQAGEITYRTDLGELVAKSALYKGSWKSPRFMPRWASRITLEITNIRVERLQEITGRDAIAEGMLPEGTMLTDLIHSADDPIEQFAQLWDSLNAKRGYSWESNCWVWCISFRKMEGR